MSKPKKNCRLLYNNIDIVRYLIMHGADIHLANYNETNLLMYAKEAYKGSGDNMLFRLYKELGLRSEDIKGNNLLYYLN